MIAAVTQTVEALVLDLLEWLRARDRTYAETMDAWRTSCPNLPIWEEAGDLGWIAVEDRDGQSWVRVTPAGSEFLQRGRRIAEPGRSLRQPA
ncbi:MAG TPA: hypothetical protein VMI94_28360 [Bryobacteraceae bacterium]|nr:hypothetical protein [Bryobacteraceae bacterium]